MKSKSRRRGDSNFILQNYCAFFFHFSPSFCQVYLAYSDLHSHQDFKIKLPKLPQKKKRKAFRVSPRYPFTGQNSKIFPVRLVYFSVRNRGCTCTGALASIVYTGRYGTVSPTLSSTDCIYQGLKGNFNPMLNICSTDNLSIEINENQFFRSDFMHIHIYLFRLSFLIILDIYKVYFKGHLS